MNLINYLEESGRITIGMGRGAQLITDYSDELRFLSNSDSFDNNIFRTKAGYIIPTVTGSISFLSSALIISIIARSVKNRCTSTYHRTMVWMSLSDMLSSAAIALTTIPMPADVSEVYDFAGESFGTTRTCELQGLCYSLGTRLSFCANCFLGVFYLLTIRYQISDRVLTKIVEPIFFCVSIAVSVCPTILMFMNGMFNPVPFVNWCSSGDYPYGCNQDESADCIRGDDNSRSTLYFSLQVIIGIILFQVIPLLMVVASVYNREHENGPSNSTGESEQDSQAGNVRYAETKTIAKQAVMYTVAFAITYICAPNITAKTDSKLLQILTIVLKPLQGLFNAMIFIYLKIYALREADNSLYFSEAVYLVIVSPKDVPGMLLEIPAEMTGNSYYPTAIQRYMLRNKEEEDNINGDNINGDNINGDNINGHEAKNDDWSREEGQSGNEVYSYELSYGRASNVNSLLEEGFSEDSLPISLGTTVKC